MESVSITSLGTYTPPDVMTNDQLISRFGLSIDSAWIEERTGIQSRHWAVPGQSTSDLAVEAIKAALDKVGLVPSQMDRLILATITGDHPSPSTATIVARKLGARCMAFDLSAACAGALYGLDLGVASVRNGDKVVVVAAADCRSRFLDPTDHRALVLFGDGAAAAVLQPTDKPGFLATACGAEGQVELGAWVPAGGSARPTSAQTVAEGLHYVQIDRKALIFDQFVRFTVEICGKVLDRCGLTVDDIDVFVTHQGNARLVEALADALGIPRRKAVSTITHHGNTAGAAVLMGLVEAQAQGQIRPGDRVLISSVGAGSAFGAAVHQF